MNKTLMTTALFVAMASTSVYAHHPAEGVSPVWDMIDENVADTPHADLVFDDMGGGRDMDDVGASMESREEMEGNSSGDLGSRGVDAEMSRAERDEIDPPGNDDLAVDTLDTLDNVMTSLGE